MLLAILPIISLIWLLVTLLTGLPFFQLRLNIPPSFHVKWAVITVIIVIGLQYLWIRLISRGQPNKIRREIVSLTYLNTVWLFLAAAVGLGAWMNFFPLIIHQIIAWPLVPFFFWVNWRQLTLFKRYFSQFL